MQDYKNKAAGILNNFHFSEEKLQVPHLTSNINKKIDHTLLKPEAAEKEIITLCEEAIKYKFAAVCVNPVWVASCKYILKNVVNTCTVIGFPLGASDTYVKVFEAERAIFTGANELDMVMNIGKLKSGDYEFVRDDISQVVKAARGNAIVKVILENVLLTDEEKVIASLICMDAKASFVKTSTGFNKGGAVLRDIALMKYTVGDLMYVKAAGGIRTREDAEKMIAAGADRIGTSSGVSILAGENKETGY